MTTKTVRRQTLETYAAMVLHANAKRDQYFNMTEKQFVRTYGMRLVQT